MSNKVIAVVIDGLRYDAACRSLGYLQHLVETHQAARFKVKSELPSLSRPLYEVLLTGTPSSENGITSNQNVRNSKENSLFHLTREQGLKNATAAYYWVSELYNRAPFHFVDDREQINTDRPIQYGKFYFEDTYPDSHLIIDGEILRKKYNPDFLYIHSMNVDDAGHKFGSDSKEYQEKILAVDAILAQLLPVWMEAGYHILITSDHGMNEFGYHGGATEGERDVPLFAISPKIAPGIYEETVPQLAFAPLICDLLEIKKSDKMIDDPFPGLQKVVPSR